MSERLYNARHDVLRAWQPGSVTYTTFAEQVEELIQAARLDGFQLGREDAARRISKVVLEP